MIFENVAISSYNISNGTVEQLVPLFINQGEKVKVDTRDSSYMGRVKS